MPNVRLFFWIILISYLNACGIDDSFDSDHTKKYLTFDLRLIGLRADFTTPQKLDSAKFQFQNCADPEMNRNIEVTNFSQPQTLILEKSPINCQISLTEFTLSGKSVRERYTSIEKSNSLSLIAGQRKIYSSNQDSKVEVIIEPVSNASSSRWYTYRIALKPELAGRSRSLTTTSVDFNASSESSFLFISKVKFLRATRNKEIAAYLIELSCPQKMINTKCIRWDLLDHEFFFLNKDQVQMQPETLISLARTSMEPIKPKIQDIVGSTFKLTMITESTPGGTVGLLDLWQDQARIYTITLPK